VTTGITRFGDAALRLRFAPGAGTRALLEALRRVPGVVDAVVTEEHALVTFEPRAPPSAERLIAAVRLAQSAPGMADAPTHHFVRARYDGPDLDHVARLAGMTIAEVVQAHATATYEVAVVGFLPGFAYLRGLDPRLAVPRRDAPRARVPALSLGVAGPYTGIYPFASPGGWNLIGEAVGFVPFDVRTGTRLQLGDRVRFTPEVR
jgi:5-oxoprolinase (ATP-hydrolysing) subunit A